MKLLKINTTPTYNRNAPTPRVTLVGAGPGDPDLLTIKALKALGKADVVLYDALVNKEILDYTPDHTLKVFVGKRANKHRFPQEIISQMIVEYAQEYGHVVRLKGGDSFIFGRGYEELEEVRKVGIEVTVIPGISSATSLTALQQVPLTCRGVNDSFWVVTATTRFGELSKDVALAAQANTTAVILMGRKKLEQIAMLFSAYGKSETPAMLIQNGSLPNEKIAIGQVHNIAEITDNEGIGTPAIIVIGEVVGLHSEYVKATVSSELLISKAS